VEVSRPRLRNLSKPPAGTIAEDLVVVGVLTPQDRRPEGAAKGIVHESPGELYASTGQEVPGFGHIAQVRDPRYRLECMEGILSRSWTSALRSSLKLALKNSHLAYNLACLGGEEWPCGR
jgi:hypothetical protein